MWQYYNPNPLSRRVGDCSVRAISKALNIDWETAFDLIADDGEDGAYDRGMSSRGSYRGGSYRMPRGGSYRDDRSYDDGSFARGRSRNARRDSMGRYSREDGYSRADDMVEDLRGMMESAPDEKTRQEFQRFISKMEQMQ